MVLFRTMNARHLRERKLRTFLTLGGVAAGVALVFSISVINATLLSTFRSSIRDLAGAAEIEVAAPDQGGLPSATVDEVEAGSPFGRIDLEGGFGLTGTGMVLSQTVVDEIGEGPVSLDAPSGIDRLDV